MVFRRRRRADVGKYQHPPARPLAPAEHVVEDGVMISDSAVRLMLKNQIIVGALRDHADFDPDTLAESARTELLMLADENDATARRLDQERFGEPDLPIPKAEHERISREDHLRRPEIHRLLADALRAQSDDAEQLALLVTRARDDAADEISRELTTRLVGQTIFRFPGYEAGKAERIRHLIEIDLAGMASPEILPAAYGSDRPRT